MIYKGGKEITGYKTPFVERIRKGVTIQGVYRMGVTLYQAIRSCFGSGVWFNTKPWIEDEGWKN